MTVCRIGGREKTFGKWELGIRMVGENRSSRSSRSSRKEDVVGKKCSRKEDGEINI